TRSQKLAAKRDRFYSFSVYSVSSVVILLPSSFRVFRVFRGDPLFCLLSSPGADATGLASRAQGRIPPPLAGSYHTPLDPLRRAPEAPAWPVTSSASPSAPPTAPWPTSPSTPRPGPTAGWTSARSPPRN